MNVEAEKKPNETWKEKLAANWLTNLIAGLAFIISIISLISLPISCNANKIAKTAELPYFKFSMHFDGGQDEILIHNEGGKLRELENPQTYLFWGIRSDKTLRDTVYLPVINYYNLGSRDPLLSSKTPVTISAANPAKAEALIDGLKKLAKENDFLIFMSAKWYVRLQYKDVYEDPHDDMYEVNPGGCRKMTKNEAVEVIKEYNDKAMQGMTIDMHLATPEILYGKWQSKTEETASVSSVLGRTIRLDALCDDFEDKNWCYDYQKGGDLRGLWRRGSGRGEPELLTRVPTPDGGRSGSIGALEVRTNKIDGNDAKSNQEDFLTVEFKQKLKHSLTRTSQPVFLVRVWLPPFDEWGNYYWFGFRQEAWLDDKNKYYPSIFLVSDKQTISKPFFRFRIGTGVASDIYGGPIKQSGWWTLAIAFDEKGVGYYYARPGVSVPTENDKMFDTKQFKTNNGTANPFMDHVLYSFFSLMYPPSGNESPRFVIDDYEVWVVKNSR